MTKQTIHLLGSEINTDNKNIVASTIMVLGDRESMGPQPNKYYRIGLGIGRDESANSLSGEFSL